MSPALLNAVRTMKDKVISNRLILIYVAAVVTVILALVVWEAR